MLKIIAYCIDLIFPPRETELLIRRLKNKLENHYQPSETGGIRFLCSYEETLIRALIKENKYHRNEEAAKLLAELLTRWLLSEGTKSLVLVPIPQSKERAKEREHNQVETFMKHVRRSSTVTINTNLIKKTRHTETQISLDREKRLSNIAGSFSYTGSKIPNNTTIVIIDDVVTTGATLKAAQASLAPHLPKGTEIILLAIAH